MDITEQLARSIVAVECSHPVRVAIDGISGAGKSTLSEHLAPIIERFGRPVIRASVDDFHRPRAERYVRGVLSPEGYYFDTFDHPSLRELLLLPLGPGGNLRYVKAVFDPRSDRPLDQLAEEAAPDAVFITDGVFLLRPGLNDLWDYRVLVACDPAEAARRGVARDQAWMASTEEVEELYRLRYTPGEQLYLDEVRPHELADAVIENTDPARPSLSFPMNGPELASRCKLVLMS